MSVPQPKLIDFRVPMTWLITGALVVSGAMLKLGWESSAQTSKLDQLILAQVKLEKRLDDRDSRMDSLRDNIYTLQRTTDTNSLRITALETTKK
jgi:CII-binding regulator of phage lambda lysogenization HflD